LVTRSIEVSRRDSGGCQPALRDVGHDFVGQVMADHGDTASQAGVRYSQRRATLGACAVDARQARILLQQRSGLGTQVLDIPRALEDLRDLDIGELLPKQRLEAPSPHLEAGVAQVRGENDQLALAADGATHQIGARLALQGPVGAYEELTQTGFVGHAVQLLGAVGEPGCDLVDDVTQVADLGRADGVHRDAADPRLEPISQVALRNGHQHVRESCRVLRGQRFRGRRYARQRP
jgi:hypothetical protein